MPYFALVAALLGFIGTANAQTSPTAHQIDSIVNQWSDTLDSNAREIADLKKQLADMKEKCGEPCQDKPKK